MTARAASPRRAGDDLGLRRLLREAGKGALLPIVLTVGAGLGQAMAVAAIGLGAQMLLDAPIPWGAAVIFLAVLVVLAVLSALSHLAGQRMVERIAATVATRAGGAIVESELAIVEAMGGVRVVDAITRNAASVRRGAHALLGLVFAAAQLTGLLGALILFAPWTMLMLAAVAIAGYHIQDRVRARATVIRQQADRADARLTLLTRHLVSGFREVLGSQRREADLVAHHLLPAANDLSPLRQVARSTAVLAGIATGVALALVFVATFVAPALGFTAAIALAVFVASHTYDGLQAVVTYLPLISEAGLAIGRLDGISAALRRDHVPPSDRKPPRVFEKIEFRGVSHTYAGSDAVALGPFDLVLNRGELVFITGGNGSGKSTLIKLLTGLYRPTSGMVLVDGRTWHIDDQRGLFSAVFTDFHLFDTNSAPPGFDRERAAALLDMLELSGHVGVSDTGFVAPRLSTGRRKRLALAQALMEDRPILVLDEWTADQDAEFRAEFFRHMLPSLMRQGRTIVAVTHDERFFDCCDRLLHLADGRLDSETLVHGAMLAEPG